MLWANDVIIWIKKSYRARLIRAMHKQNVIIIKIVTFVSVRSDVQEKIARLALEVF